MADFTKLKKIAEESGEQAMKKLAKPAEKEASMGTKVMDALGAPQRYLSKKAAEVSGLKAAATSEENFANIVEKGADLMGVPKDSVAGNVAKAGAVAAAEVFGDPLQFIPLGKIAKGVKGLSGMKELPAIAKIAEEAKLLNFGKAKRAKQLDELATALKPRDMQLVTDESSRATETYKKLMSSKEAQESASKVVARERGAIEKGRDMSLADKALKEAQKTGVKPEDQEKFIRLYTKARGGMKP